MARAIRSVPWLVLMLRLMKLGENFAILEMEVATTTIAHHTRIAAMTAINRAFLMVIPMAGSGAIPEEDKTPPRFYRTQRRTTSGAQVRSTRTIGVAAPCRSGSGVDGSRQLQAKRLNSPLSGPITIT